MASGVTVNTGGAAFDLAKLQAALPPLPKHGDKFTYQVNGNSSLFVWAGPPWNQWGMFNVGHPFAGKVYKPVDLKLRPTVNVMDYLFKHPRYLNARGGNFATQLYSQNGVGSCNAVAVTNSYIMEMARAVVFDTRPRCPWFYPSLPGVYGGGRTDFVAPILNPKTGRYDDGGLIINSLLSGFYGGIPPVSAELNYPVPQRDLLFNWVSKGVPAAVKAARCAQVADLQRVDSWDGVLSALNEYHPVMMVWPFAFDTRGAKGDISTTLYDKAWDANQQKKVSFAHACPIIGYTTKGSPNDPILAILDGKSFRASGPAHPDFPSGNVGMLPLSKVQALAPKIAQRECYIVPSIVPLASTPAPKPIRSMEHPELGESGA